MTERIHSQKGETLQNNASMAYAKKRERNSSKRRVGKPHLKASQFTLKSNQKESKSKTKSKSSSSFEELNQYYYAFQSNVSIHQGKLMISRIIQEKKLIFERLHSDNDLLFLCKLTNCGRSKALTTSSNPIYSLRWTSKRLRFNISR